ASSTLASLSGRELASAERRTGVSSTPCTPQSQRHVRSRRKDTGGPVGAHPLHSGDISRGFGPPTHHTGGAAALLKSTAFEANGNIACSGGGSLTSLTGSPALNRRSMAGVKNMDKSSANFLDYYLSLESAVRQKREACGEQIAPVSANAAASSTNIAISAVNSNGVLIDDNREKAADEALEKHVKPDAAEVPAGWEKHEDEEGAYYWHIATGTIQREMPTVEATNRLTAQHKRLAMPATVTFRTK
ncbi:amyloid beta A4 precursor protein-binding family B member 2-like, partial [Tropilaelaps mercedesae]